MQQDVNQMKKGFAVTLNDNLYYVIDHQHVKPGKGGAFVRLKLKHIEHGNVVDRTFKSGEKIQVEYIDKKTIQYLYSSRDVCEFMDHETYEQIALHKDQLGDMLYYLKENIEVTALMHKGRVLSLEPPIFIDMKITSTEPGIRGDTSRAGTKPATTETGMTITVPLFISEGDIVRIDTRTKEYAGRT